MLEKKMYRLAAKAFDIKPCKHKSLKVDAFGGMSKLQHKMILKSEIQSSLDNQLIPNHGKNTECDGDKNA